jgi:HPt (histidine-containing phosphotransfer) domain-containing protein
VPDDPTALALTARLSPAALAGLREAFAAEVAERLPRLRAAAAGGTSVHLVGALRDAHTLGTSAVIVGEPQIARSAREVERLLRAYDDDPTGTEVLAEVRARVDDLNGRLAGWQQ